jgi:uncharacterized protein YoxC
MPLEVVVPAAALVAGIIIGASVQKVVGEFTQMKNSLEKLTEKIDRIEKSQTNRNPYRTNDGLEDAMAIIHDTVWQADATLDYVRARMKQVNTTLKTIRSDPDKYNPDKPNQKK